MEPAHASTSSSGSGSDSDSSSSSSSSDDTSDSDLVDDDEEGYRPPDKEFIDVPVAELNPFLSCTLCNGYFRDAHTTVECLHTCKRGYG
jgi:hypothetical protein